MGTSYRVRIGLKELSAMQPNTILWDQEVRGFVARRQFSDIITFSVVYRTKEGVQRWQKLERFPILTPNLARQEAIRILRAKALGQDPAGEKMTLRNGMTVAQLCDEYSARENGKKPTTVKGDRSRIKTHIVPKLGRLKAASVTSEQVEDFMHSLSAGSQGRTVGLLGSIFSYAIKKKLRLDNPVRGVERPKDVRRMRRLSEGEYQQFAKAINGVGAANDIFQMLILTGWRSSEVRLLKFSECDLERRVATLGDTKTGMSIRPLCAAAIKIIEAQPIYGEYVFTKKGKLITSLHRHWARLGLAEDVTPHSLRHSFASLAADMGLPDHTIARLLGHRQQSITSRYIHMERSIIEAADAVAVETLRLMRL